MKKTKLQQLLEAVRSDNNIDLLRSALQDINSYDGSLDYLEYYENDDDFFDTFFKNTQEAVRAVCYGEYSYNNDYVKFNAYGNLESVSEYEYEDIIKKSSYEIATELERLIEEGSLDIDDYDNYYDYDEDQDESEDEDETI